MSLPFIDEVFTFTQPDGSTLQVRGTGNQNAATFETLDGFTVVQDPVSHFYHYARPGPAGALVPAGIRPGAADPELLGLAAGLRPPSVPGTELPPPAMEGLPASGSRWRQRREEYRRRAELRAMAEDVGFTLAPPTRETVGTFVGLTLLIDFEDFPATISRAQVEAYCNQPGYNGFGNNGSVRDYFHDVSDGKLDYTNVVTPYYRAKHKRGYYTDPKVPYTKRTVELIREALDHLVGNGFDATVLTSDQQDYIYAVNVFYAGTRDNNWSEGLWPHAYYIGGGGYQLAPGKIAHDYQITDMTDELTLGTFCHENGHLICDFPDLYDYGEDGVKSRGVGVFCLMCAGGKGAGAKNPSQVGAYLKHAAGWTSDLADLPSGASITLAAGNNQFAMRRKNAKEYFIVENRAATGRDAVLPGSGLAVWHVDEGGDNEHQSGSPSKHYECALMQADGLRELERGIGQGDAGDLFRAGHKDSFTPMTSPNSNWWDRSDSGLQLLQIGPAGPSMRFDVG
ncbi:MAG TPA: M6 family metalloprotease domain-containing protein [Allosphingosinicella sp.]|nr:M6 family metalloprotease domain-containing protein [Allosphingosinicella sp.]